MYYLLSFIPIIMNVILMPAKHLYAEYLYDNIGFFLRTAAFVQFFWEPVITPVYFIVLHIYFTKFAKRKKLKRYVSMIALLLAVLINASIDYLWWGFSTGRLTNPDDLTVMVIKAMIYFPLLIGYSGIGIFELAWYIIKRKKNNMEK